VSAKHELEELLSVVTKDENDLTGLVYLAIKDTQDKRDLLRFRKLCKSAELERRLEQIADRRQTVTITREETNSRPSFEDLLNKGRNQSI